MLKSKLTKATINELVNAYLAYKKAKNFFEKLKTKACTDLMPGKFLGDEGFVQKTCYETTRLDMDKLKSDYPKINFDKYRVSSQIEKVTIGVNKD